MPIEIENGLWKCTICGKLYDRDTNALSCEQSHDYIYVKLKRDDLFKLLQFLMTKDEQLLSPSLINTLMKYSKGEYK